MSYTIASEEPPPVPRSATRASPGPGAVTVLGDDPVFRASVDRIHELRCLPNPYHPGPEGRRAPLRFVVRGGSDPRDLIGDEVDLLLVRDKAMVDYAERFPGFRVVPAPWDRTYFLLTRYARTPEATDQLLGAVKVQLSNEVVLAAAEPQIGSTFLDRGPGSHRLLGGSTRERYVFSQVDLDAARIAERLVAVSRTEGTALFPGDHLASVLGLSPVEFEESLAGDDRVGQWGNARETAYVFSVPGMTARFSDDLEIWFMSVGLLDPRVTGPAFGMECIPLVATRPHLVVREDVVGISFRGGSLHLDRAGWGETLP